MKLCLLIYKKKVSKTSFKYDMKVNFPPLFRRNTNEKGLLWHKQKHHKHWRLMSSYFSFKGILCWTQSSISTAEDLSLFLFHIWDPLCVIPPPHRPWWELPTFPGITILPYLPPGTTQHIPLYCFHLWFKLHCGLRLLDTLPPDPKSHHFKQTERIKWVG